MIRGLDYFGCLLMPYFLNREAAVLHKSAAGKCSKELR